MGAIKQIGMSLMNTITASDMKNRLAQVFDKALVSPLRITRRGANSFVLLSSAEYERLEAAEDQLLASKVEGILSKPDFLSVEESVKFMKDNLA